ncbi:DISARM system helicase DrmA [Bacillus altitudinis]|uniref:DISARM system helicase DrmA n=1 Tax=Bacillus altitudinis TaxID=293387 RepID=UPI002404A513|nr:DISARM system helicase DrmA [Bacillus altitudinis]MDF9417611.1 DNA helicase [Bacillus altitudinis]
MSKEERAMYKKVRRIMVSDLKRDLIGPAHDEPDVIYEAPSQAYITGILYPLESEIETEELLEDVQFAEVYDEPKGGMEEDMEHQSNSEPVQEAAEEKITMNKKFKHQNSMGIRCYVRQTTNYLRASVAWGRYTSSKKFDFERNREVIVWTRQIECFEESISLSSVDQNIDISLTKEVSLVISKKKLSDTDVFLISAFLVNKRVDKNSNNAMFQCELTLFNEEGKGVFLCENEARKDKNDFSEFLYRNKPVFAKGFGCAVTWKAESSNYASELKSAFIPEHEIESMSTDSPYDEVYGDLPKSYFSIKQFAESNNKCEIMDKLENLAKRYENWINKLSADEVVNKEATERVIKDCKITLTRMKKGIELLGKKGDNNAFAAFKFMNTVMHTQDAMKRYSRNNMITTLENEISKENLEWRPFQLAFILLNLEGLVDPKSEDRKIVDLLWFPTGGGKTEAYLGISAFLLGYRRLVASTNSIYERDGGVTILLRYTLRLLTTQQRDRLMRMISACEYTRQKNKAFGQTEFSVGFWVGGQVTVNKLNDLTENQYNRDRDKVLKEYDKIEKQVIECPCCGAKGLEYKFLPSRDTKTKKTGINIFCKNESCFFSKTHIPVYLVDEEIYRKLPTVIISTVDKFARLPWDEKTTALFGKVNRLCERCGYIAEGENHQRSHRNPKASVQDVKPFYPPELIIQDELHLITGPLGTVYGGYETVIEELSTAQEGKDTIKPKYIAATATIKNAEVQVEKVFGRKLTQQFPPSGLKVEDSFFARERSLDEFPFRLYAGVCVSGHSMKTVLLRIYAVLLQTTEHLLEDEALSKYVDPFRTLVGYFNSIRELGGAVRLLEDDIKKRIQTLQKKYKYSKQRYISRKPELTSRVPSSRIPKVLEQLEREVGNEELDVVLATNMISVGMDVDRLGLMVITGQPKQTSEYIQSSSRVGRSKPGLVITVYNPYRPRDMSHYQNFKSYHQRLYHFVEGTTATPYASRARDRVLHAIAVALLRLSYPELAKNVDAKNIKDMDMKYIKEVVKKRVSTVEYRNVSDTMDHLQHFLEEWINLAKSEDNLQYYFHPNTKHARIESRPRLLARFSEDKKYGGKTTLDSMRQVEGTSSLYIYEGWNSSEE